MLQICVNHYYSQFSSKSLLHFLSWNIICCVIYIHYTITTQCTREHIIFFIQQTQYEQSITICRRVIQKLIPRFMMYKNKKARATIYHNHCPIYARPYSELLALFFSFYSSSSFSTMRMNWAVCARMSCRNVYRPTSTSKLCLHNASQVCIMHHINITGSAKKRRNRNELRNSGTLQFSKWPITQRLTTTRTYHKT